MRKGHHLQKTIIRVLIWGPIVYAVLLFWWTFTGAFEGVMSNGHSQTYAEYRQCDKVFEFDPIGAHDPAAAKLHALREVEDSLALHQGGEGILCR